MTERTILMIVPGPVDRAFYKALITKLYDNVEDLDSGDCKREREYLLRSIIRSESYRWVKTSVLRISRPRRLILIIKPSEKSVKEETKIVLRYLLGCEDSRVRYVVATEDAEELSFDARLQSLVDSVRSIQAFQRDINIRELSRGSTYSELLIESSRTSVNLFIMVQGVPGLRIFHVSPAKHAIEDYIIYMHSSLMEVLSNNRLLLDIISGSNVHKKVATLIALACCYNSVNEKFLFSIDCSYYERLVSNVECLREFKENVLDKLLYSIP